MSKYYDNEYNEFYNVYTEDDPLCELCGEPLDQCGFCPICDHREDETEYDDEDLAELNFEEDRS